MRVLASTIASIALAVALISIVNFQLAREVLSSLPYFKLAHVGAWTLVANLMLLGAAISAVSITWRNSRNALMLGALAAAATLGAVASLLYCIDALAWFASPVVLAAFHLKTYGATAGIALIVIVLSTQNDLKKTDSFAVACVASQLRKELIDMQLSVGRDSDDFRSIAGLVDRLGVADLSRVELVNVSEEAKRLCENKPQLSSFKVRLQTGVEI